MFSFRTISRRAPALALAATLLASALGPPAFPGVAASERPDARLQVFVKQISVKNDHDWHSEGDMTFTVKLLRCPARTGGCGAKDQELLARSKTTFGASSGQTVTLDRVFPENDELIGSEESYAVVAGERYVLELSIIDRDSPAAGLHDQLGQVGTVLTSANDWGLGSYTEQSTGWKLGEFEITYEIRRAPLPDLRTTGIKIHDLPGDTRKLACMGVWNAGQTDAGPFTVALQVDGLVPPGGAVSAGDLASGASGELCGEVTLPASGQHKLTALVDAWDTQLEYNEANNTYEQAYTAPVQQQPPVTPKPTSSQGPAPTATEGRADLTVTALKVNGRAPDGKDDCKDGKNAVAVIVKNQGTKNAGDFAVRLIVDGEQAAEQAVSGLEAGKEREVRFDDARLKKGERKLTASVDAKGAVAESVEENNEREISARCKDS